MLTTKNAGPDEGVKVDETIFKRRAVTDRYFLFSAPGISAAQYFINRSVSPALLAREHAMLAGRRGRRRCWMGRS